MQKNNPSSNLHNLFAMDFDTFRYPLNTDACTKVRESYERPV